MTNLSRTIAELIATGKEGDHWDFKREQHSKAGDLIHDIVCLANSTRHTGDRYIIYGVDDTGSVIGLQAPSKRNQADIVHTLSAAGFAGGVYPDIYLHQVSLQGQQLEVLVIKDRPEKPYYLQREYDQRGVRLHASTIYARVRDSNTSRNQVAPFHDIEHMWRERFCLDQTPFQRVLNYLLDRQGWTESSEDIWYYSQFPEFTISPAGDDVYPVQSGENWVRAATNPSAFVQVFKICFHQTMLAEIPCILYDEMRERTPAPQATMVNPIDGLHFFSLCADTLEFLFLQFLTGKDGTRLMQDGLPHGRGTNLPVIIFRSGEESRMFQDELRCNPVTDEERRRFTIEWSDPMVNELDRKIIAYSRTVNERLIEWRATKP